MLTVDVSTQGCGMNAGQSFSINARNKGVENGGVSFEVFKKGHVNNLIADNVEVVFNQPADPDVSAACVPRCGPCGTLCAARGAPGGLDRSAAPRARARIRRLLQPCSLAHLRVA